MTASDWQARMRAARCMNESVYIMIRRMATCSIVNIIRNGHDFKVFLTTIITAYNDTRIMHVCASRFINGIHRLKLVARIGNTHSGI